MRRKVDSASAKVRLIDIGSTRSGCMVPDERLYDDCLVPRSKDRCSKKGDPHWHHRNKGRHAAHCQTCKIKCDMCLSISKVGVCDEVAECAQVE